MKLLYIWIEEFRDIYNQGIIVDNELLIKVRNPHHSSFGYYTDDGNRILSTTGVPKYGRKIFTREISWSPNEDYIQNKIGSAINSIAALVGKNATGKSSILTCLSSQEHEYLRIDDRYYLLVFLNQSEHCIEIRARGIQVVAENIVLRYSRKSDMYQVYIIPLEEYSPIYPGELDEQTLFYFLIPQKSVKSFIGYSVLGIPTIVGDLDAFDQQNAFDGAFEFLCQFPNLVSSGNKLVIYLNSTDRNQRNDYFEKPSLTCAEYKKFFIHRLAQILFSNLRSYLYHPTPEFTVDGTRIKLPNEERLMEEDRQCAQLLATFSGPYPNAGSSDLISFKTNNISRDGIKNLLKFFENSTFSFNGKFAYNEYIKRITELFDTLFGADDKLFSAIFKLEIPFQNEYIPIVSAMQECINISNILNGNWANGVHVRFEWFSSGEFHIAMLFSAIYQRMKEVNKKDINNRDIIWAIDEPEMHMHPELGRNFIDELNRAMQQFKDRGFFRVCQFIFATHSPFLVQNLGRYTSTLTLVDKTKNQISTTAFEKMPQLRFPGREELSFNLIMYQIFGIPTVELHNELYGVLQELTHCYDEKNFEKWLVKEGVPQNIPWIREKNGVPQSPYSVTLETYIRNSIHHPENHSNPYCYSTDDLKNSIQEMLLLLSQFY